MSNSFYDVIVIIFFTAFPILLIALHILFSTRKKMVFGFIIPAVWTALGIWMVKGAVNFPVEMAIFFGGGLLLLLAILAFIKVRKSKKGKGKK